MKIGPKITISCLMCDKFLNFFLNLKLKNIVRFTHSIIFTNIETQGFGKATTHFLPVFVSEFWKFRQKCIVFTKFDSG